MWFKKKIGTGCVVVCCWLFLSGHAMCSERPVSGKIHPVLRQMLTHKGSAAKTSFPNYMRRMDDKEMVGVFIRTDDPEALRRRGVRVRTVVGNIVTATLSLSMVESVAGMSSVKSIEPGLLCRPLLDKSTVEIGVDRIRAGELGSAYRGEGVIVGVYDSGIDWSHPDFINASGQSRILFLWDQTDTTSHRSPPVGFGYGREYTQADIDDEIDGSPTGIVQGKDRVGHGTHVAGIAAGNGRGTGNGQLAGVYSGVANEADLVVVKGGDGQYVSDNILDGLAYIFQKAGALDRPCVINLSVGGLHLGPHDGTSAFEQGVDNLLWEEGRAIVVAAGNEGDNAIHFKGILSGGQVKDSLTIIFRVGQNKMGMEDYVLFDVWYAPYTGLSVSVISPTGVSYGPVESGVPPMLLEKEWGVVFVNNASAGVYEENGDMEILIRISDSRTNGTSNDDLAAGDWKLRFWGNSGRFDGWLYESSMGAWITEGADQSTLIAEPGNSFHAITVGSYVSREEWPSLFSVPWGPENLTVGALSTFSSPGPTRPASIMNDEIRQKPEIAAPGEFILSSLSSHMLNPPSDHYIATDGVHWALSGTSMAAPHVTGVVALMFEANPELTSSEIKGKLVLSARKDSYTGSAWNPSWGHGKLNALEALRLTSVKDEAREGLPTAFFLFQNYPNPFNGVTIIEFTIPPDVYEEIRLAVFDLKGRLVYTLFEGISAGSGRRRVRWNGQGEDGNPVPSGVYVCRLRVGEMVLNRKMIYIR